MLDKWLNIGKRRRKLIDRIIALDNKNRHSKERLSYDSAETLQLKLSWLQQDKTQDRPSVKSVVAFDNRIDDLIKKAKADGMWDNNPKKGKWL